MNREDQLKHAVRIIAAFVWNVHLKRAMAANDMPDQNLWRVISGNMMDIAAIEWCKLFGSDSEPVHWRRNIPEGEHEAFRKGLCQATGQTLDKWREYREAIKSYRDEHAAHFDLENFAPGTVTYPQYDQALEACYYYYERLLEQFEKDGIGHTYPPDIREYSRKLQSCETELTRAAFDATRGMKESVR